MPSPFSFFGSSKKDNASDGSISPTPSSSRKDKRKEKHASSHGMTHYRDYTTGEDPRMHRLRGIDPRSNGHFVDMNELYAGSNYGGSRGDPEFIRSRLMGQFRSSLDNAVTETIRKACLHYDDEVLNLENNYNALLEERNGLRIENKSLASRVKTLEGEVNAKVALLREFQSGHLKTSGSRRLPPSSTAISTEFEALERRIKDTVFMRLARLNLHDPYIQVLLQHQPFLDAVKSIMCDQEQAAQADNVPANLLEVIEESEKKGLLLWMIQGVIHDILYRKIMEIHMPGLNVAELNVLNKVFNAIELSDEGIKSAQEWRADTYKRLAYWAENTQERGKHAESSPAISEINQVFRGLIDGTEKEIVKVLAPFCDPETSEGQNFTRLIVDIVDRAFQFSILIGSQAARYELHRDLEHTDDFRAIPEHLDEKVGVDKMSNVSLFYSVPALVKTSDENGEAYEVSELLVQGKIYVLFGYGDAVEEEEETSAVPDESKIKMASPVNGGDIGDIDAITKVDPESQTTPSKTAPEANEATAESSVTPSAQGAESLPQEPNPNTSTPKTEQNSVTATTTSSSNENATVKATSEPLNPVAAEHSQKIYTETSQGTANPENPELQRQSILQTPKEPSEASFNSELHSFAKNSQAHQTELPASPSLPNPAQISSNIPTPSQVDLPPPQPSVVTQEHHTPTPVPVTTVPLPVQTKDLTHPASHTLSEEALHPQAPAGTQPEPSLEASTPSTSQTERTLPSEPELSRNSQLTNNSSVSSVAQLPLRPSPAELIRLNSSSVDSKNPTMATAQEARAADVETVG